MKARSAQLRPYVTETSLTDMVVGVDVMLRDLDIEPGKVKDGIRRDTAKVFALDLPLVVKSRTVVSLKFGGVANELQEFYCNGQLGSEKAGEVRKAICGEVTCILYRDYIDECYRAAKDFFSRNKEKLSTVWGFESFVVLSRDGFNWGKNFVSFWRKTVGDEGSHIFRKRFLEPLRRELQVEAHEKKRWAEMTDEQIADTLKDILPTVCDPAESIWNFAQIGKCVYPTRFAAGDSFIYFWKKKFGKKAYGEFARRILPLLPEGWRENFINWRELDDDKIVEILVGLEKSVNPEVKKWGLLSLFRWKRREINIGRSFVAFWRRHREETGDKLFREQILSKMPESYQKTYRYRGFKLELLPSTDETKGAVVEIDDFDELYKIAAEEKNPDAFDKLVDLLLDKFGSRYLFASRSLIERFVNLHLPVFGSIGAYVAASLAYCAIKYSKGFTDGGVSDYTSESSLPGDSSDEEDDGEDYGGMLVNLKAAGFSVEDLGSLNGLLSGGETLKSVAGSTGRLAELAGLLIKMKSE